MRAVQSTGEVATLPEVASSSVQTIDDLREFPMGPAHGLRQGIGRVRYADKMDMVCHQTIA